MSELTLNIILDTTSSKDEHRDRHDGRLMFATCDDTATITLKFNDGSLPSDAAHNFGWLELSAAIGPREMREIVTVLALALASPETSEP